MSLTLKKPGREREERAVEREAQRLAGADKRIVADVPARIHRQLKMRCLERGVLVRDYILDLLARDGLT